MSIALDRRQALRLLPTLAGVASASRAVAAEPALRLAAFSADVTPRLGGPIYSGGFLTVTAIDDPLEARGFVLLGAGQPIVQVAVDWCEIRNDAYDRWRGVLAEAAGTTVDRVLVSSIHQHDAPLGELRAQRLLEEFNVDGRMCDLDFHEQAVQRTADALSEALSHAQPITHLGLGQAKVDQVASNRRVELPGGKITFSRYSRTTDATVQALPEGEIDPWLKTISFWNGEKPVCALHSYATHPMSYYGTGAVSCEFVGLARAQRQLDLPDVHQVYVSGCSGDVTAGKYNDGTQEHRQRLTDRMCQAMRQAWDKTVRRPLANVECRSAPLLLPHRDTPGLVEADLRQRLADRSLSFTARASAALGLSSRLHNPEGHAIDLQVIDLGAAQIVLLPAESFVGYQLLAQRQRPDLFVMAIGFGECAPGYIPTELATREGFVQEHGYCWVADGSEARITAALKQAMQA